MSTTATIPFAELVFGFVYAVGTNPDAVISVLRNYLRQFGYQHEEFRVSKHLGTLELGISYDNLSEYDRMRALMNAGNEARRRAGNDIVAVMAINDIADRRPEQDGRPVPRQRVAHFIRSLKRPEEVQLLRQVYRPGFFLIGIADDEDSQRAYLTDEVGLSESEAESAIEHDQEEHIPGGQRTRDTFYLADVFVELTHERYRSQLSRFLDVVFAHPFKTPTRHEHAMFMAYASAARSAQLGRQVGSAITTPEGEVVAVGMNEVPSRRGGPYWEGDADDARDHKKKIDPNYSHRERIVRSIVGKLEGKLLNAKAIKQILLCVARQEAPSASEAELEARAKELLPHVVEFVVPEPAVNAAIHESDLREITEYGRAVHGEMDALLTCARLGIETMGKYLYVTTFPCHNCTRHIIAAGIKKVFYIEPYPKSKARDLHEDAVCFDEQVARHTKKIPFLPFVGIGPRRYLDLFSLELSSGRKIERKDAGNAPVVLPKGERQPRIPMTALSYLDREDEVINDHRQALIDLQGRENGADPTENSHSVEPSQDSAEGE